MAFASLMKAQTAPDSCEPSAAVRAGLERLDIPGDTRRSGAERAATTQSILDGLFVQHPDDFFVHRRYQTIAAQARDFDPDALIQRYRELLEKHPDSPQFLDLYGLALNGFRTKEAIGYFEKALQVDPNFGWPHVDLASVYTTRAFRDQAKLVSNLQAFMKACPETLEPFQYIKTLDDMTLLGASAVRLRQIVSRRSDPEALSSYSTLWGLEFRVHPAAESDALKKQVAADVARIRSLQLTRSENWYSALSDGYELLGDAAEKRAVEDQLANSFPNSREPVAAVIGRWEAEHPWPNDSTPPDKKRAFYEAVALVTQDWLRRWPDYPDVWMFRFQAMVNLPDSSTTDIEAAAEGLLRSAARNPDLFHSSPPISLTVAREYAEKGIRLEQVPGLVSDGLVESDRRDKRLAEHDTLSEATRQMLKVSPIYVHGEALTTLATAHVKMKDPGKAQDAIAEIKALIDQHQSDKSATSEEVSTLAKLNADYWRSMAQLAELQGRKPDALAYYHSSIGYLSQLPAVLKKDDTTSEKAKNLWTSLGGTEAGWQAWLSPQPTTTATAPAETNGWESLHEPLPDFSLAGVDGKTWRLVDLKGKVALINIWATWCGPCQAELPFVQKAYDQLKGRSDVTILTLNDDENPGMAVQFMKDHGYSFPAALAYSYLNAVVPNIGLPRNWIVDRQGVRRLEAVGFGSDGDGWIKDLMANLEQIEKARN
jgi:tetratricopeptide (TPR) repeat protein